MKARVGWLLSEDEDTQKMIPFFVKVRAQDVISVNPVDIATALKETSTRWELVRMEDDIEVTVYRYEASWTSSNDVNAEVVGSELMNGWLEYYLYKDGRLDIKGVVRASGTFAAIDSVYGQISTQVYLPFALNEESPMFNIGYGPGLCPNIALGAKLGSAVVSNQQLNLNNVDTNKYPFLLNLYGIVPVNGTLSSVVPLEKIRDLADDPEYGNYDYSTYIKNYFPYRIEYHGYWRGEETVVIEEPESYSDGLLGSYKTTGAVNMLSGPSIQSEIVRPLPVNTLVKCNGYYTNVDGVNWLLCEYTNTNQLGYIPESYLEYQ